MSESENTLAYCGTELIRAAKCFIKQSQEVFGFICKMRHLNNFLSFEEQEGNSQKSYEHLTTILKVILPLQSKNYMYQ
jgi:hypothetical protein